VADYKALFTAMNASVIVNALEDIAATTSATADDPGVKVFCGYVNDTQTTTSFELNSGLNKLVSTLDRTWGDGTVPLESLEVCQRWADKTSIYQFGGSLAAHTEILTYDKAIADIIAWVNASGTIRSQ